MTKADLKALNKVSVCMLEFMHEELGVDITIADGQITAWEVTEI